MTTTTVFSTVQNNVSVHSGIATTDINETATLAIPCGGRSVVRIGVPTIDSSTLTFTVVPYPGATSRILKDTSGNTVTVSASVGGFSVVIPELSGVYTFTIVTAAQTSSAVQFQVQCVGQHPSPASANELTIESGSVSLSAGTALIGKVSASGETSTIYNGTTAITPVFAAISGATSGNNTLVAATVSKKIRVFALSVVSITAVGVKFQSGAGGTDITGLMTFGANGGYVLSYNPIGWFEAGTNTLLNMNLNSAVQVSGHITYGLV